MAEPRPDFTLYGPVPYARCRRAELGLPTGPTSGVSSSGRRTALARRDRRPAAAGSARRPAGVPLHDGGLRGHAGRVLEQRVARSSAAPAAGRRTPSSGAIAVKAPSSSATTGSAAVAPGSAPRPRRRRSGRRSAVDARALARSLRSASALAGVADAAVVDHPLVDRRHRRRCSVGGSGLVVAGRSSSPSSGLCSTLVTSPRPSVRPVSTWPDSVTSSTRPSPSNAAIGRPPSPGAGARPTSRSGRSAPAPPAAACRRVGSSSSSAAKRSRHGEMLASQA